jgi:hypothetical protein
MNEKLAKIREKINKRFKKFQSREYYRCDEWEDAKRHTDAYSKSNGDESKATAEYLNVRARELAGNNTERRNDFVVSGKDGNLYS